MGNLKKYTTLSSVSTGLRLEQARDERVHGTGEGKSEDRGIECCWWWWW